MVDSLLNLIQGLDDKARTVVVFAVIGCSMAIIITTVVTIASTIAKVQRNRTETELKREMLDRGLAADEIATIIHATAQPSEASGAATAQSFGSGTASAGTKAG